MLGKGTTATEALTGLSSNTSYTYKAYSNSNCSTELASETLLTKPGKPTQPVAAAGAGSGTLTLTASVTGSGTLTKWQYKQKEGTGNFDDDWTDIASTSTSLSHTVTGLTDGTTTSSSCARSNASGDGAESDASATVAPADESLTASSVTHHAATSPWATIQALVAEAHHPGGHHLQVQGHDRHRGPHRPVLQHQLHL